MLCKVTKTENFQQVFNVFFMGELSSLKMQHFVNNLVKIEQFTLFIVFP